MSSEARAIIPIVIIIIIVIIVTIIVVAVSVYAHIQKLKKQREEFVKRTSKTIKALKEINEKYHDLFGCLKPCDFTVDIPFKYKRTFEHFCDSEVKVAKFVLDYQDAILEKMALILKNIAANRLYFDEIDNIKPTKPNDVEFKFGLDEQGYLSIEKELFKKGIYHAPETFKLVVNATYSSEKGHSNYSMKIDCDVSWLQDAFIKYKHINLLAIAEKMAFGDHPQASLRSAKKPIVQEVEVESIEPADYFGEVSYNELLNKTYKEIVAYLLSKYGAVKGDYFCNESCKSKNKKISRTNEGLFVHHIDEDKAILLSTDSFAINNPYRYQKADRLVYCNILEHLLLHVKIAEEPRNINANPDELPGIGGAVNFISRQINDCYGDYEFKQPMMIHIKEMIKDNFDDYIMILQRLLDLVRNNPNYSNLVTKKELASGFYGNVVKRVYDSLK